MSKVKAFMKRKNIEISLKRYGIDALGAMAQGLFCSLLIGTILDTLGSQTGVEIFTTVGGYARAMSGPAMAIAIGWALKCPPLVLFSLTAVGWASNDLGGAGGPLAVLFVAIIAAEDMGSVRAMPTSAETTTPIQKGWSFVASTMSVPT